MNRPTRLVLRRETLAQLADDDLQNVAGAALGTHLTCYDCPTIHNPCLYIARPTGTCPEPRTLNCPSLAC